jgi:3' exoribonuclease, RNase T-like
MKHCMLDLETLGLRPGSSILSVAAVEFEIDGQRDRSFHANITRASCKAARGCARTRRRWYGGAVRAQRPKPRCNARRRDPCAMSSKNS